MLNKYVDQVRRLQSNSIPEDLLKSENAIEVMKLSASYYGDSSSAVRARVYSLVGKIGSKSKLLSVRQSCVSQLLTANRDADISNVGLIWSILSQFRKDDFSESAKDTMRIVFKRNPFHIDRLIKLIGYLNISDLKEEIRVITFPSHNKKDRWAALISLSRMGDFEATQSIIKKSQKIKMSDDVIYELFPDLIYTRQKEVFDYIIDVLNSDEKNCFSADAENEMPVLCGYRVMEQLAVVIDGYPLSLDDSGDIKTKDYTKALSEVRKWFHQKGSSYKINTESFE